MSPYSEFARGRYLEYFLLRNVIAEGPVVGQYEGQDIRKSIVDEWGRRYSFVGIVAFRGDGQYDVDGLKTGEFILAPGLVYRLDRMPPTWREFLFGKR
jgi:hypothetical protein